MVRHSHQSDFRIFHVPQTNHIAAYGGYHVPIRLSNFSLVTNQSDCRIRHASRTNQITASWYACNNQNAVPNANRVWKLGYHDTLRLKQPSIDTNQE